MRERFMKICRRCFLRFSGIFIFLFEQNNIREATELIIDSLIIEKMFNKFISDSNGNTTDFFHRNCYRIS